MFTKSRWVLGLSFALVLSIVGCTKKTAPLGSADNPIKFFFVPSVDAKLLSDKSKIVQKFLEENTPYKYKVQIPASYVAVVEAFGTARADVAAINTFGYIMAHEKYKSHAIATVERHGAYDYKAQIVTRKDSGIKKIEDLNGKKVAYVDPASTSGYLLPAKLFKDKNIKPSETVFAGKHDNVISMIYQGQVDAGATYYSPPAEGEIQDARRLVKTQYPDVEDKISIVTLTDPIPNDPVVVRDDLPEDVKSALQAALMKMMQTSEGKDAFKAIYGVTGMKLATDADYDQVRQVLVSLGKNAADLMAK